MPWANLLTPPTPFDEAVEFQSNSLELVIYSPTAGQYVVIAWPLASDGRRILPSGIRAWLRVRGLHWTCFCGLVNDDAPLSVRIVRGVNGRVFAFCNKTPSACGFFLDLTNRYSTASLFSSYANLPTTASGDLPSMGTILSTFLLTAPYVPGPYFDGYCGEHRIDYPNAVQLAGNRVFGQSRGGIRRQAHRVRHDARLNVCRKSHTAPVSRATTRIIRRKQVSASTSAHHASSEEEQVPPSAIAEPVAGPSRLQDEHSGGRDRDGGLVTRLQIGAGISSFDMDGLFEACDKCHCHFLASALRTHILSCSVNDQN